MAGQLFPGGITFKRFLFGNNGIHCTWQYTRRYFQCQNFSLMGIFITPAWMALVTGGGPTNFKLNRSYDENTVKEFGYPGELRLLVKPTPPG